MRYIIAEYAFIRSSFLEAYNPHKEIGPMTRLCLAFATMFALSMSVGIAQQAGVGYHIAKTYELGGEGAWDYIVPVPSQHRVYIGRTNRVMVVDTSDGKLVGEVMGIKGAHGTAIAESSGHGFATSGNDQSIVMFDLKTFKELARIPAAEDADAIWAVFSQAFAAKRVVRAPKRRRRRSAGASRLGNR